MKKRSMILIPALLLGALLHTSRALPQSKPGLSLTTTAFEDGGVIPIKYTAAAAAPISPELNWTNAPGGTASFALLVHDPDTSINKTAAEILHWMIFDIPADAHGLPESIPAQAILSDGTVQGRNYTRKIGYAGPGAPAPGPPHHYTFELFALDTKLSLGPEATQAQVLKAMDGHILDKGVLVGRFHLP
jgi:Raf kinase inhibitor-like YbhB/YbcL family protein